MKKKILVVEDDSKALKVLSLRLKSAGFEVTTAQDGVEALIVALEEKPDLVVTDVWMPVGMGFAMAYRLREKYPELPLLFITGQRRTGTKKNVAGFGNARLLEKPYQAAELLNTVREMLGEEEMPQATEHLISRAPSPAAPPPTRLGKRILIVEDDRKIAMSLSARLKSVGYEALVAGDAITGVTSALKHRPDLLLLDISLPAGNGFTVAERVQALVPTLTPIIFITASKQPDFRARALELGAAGFLEKPFKSQELLAAVEKALKREPERALTV